MPENDVRETISTIILGKHGIVYEDREDFPTSIFHKVYRRAFELARHSVKSQMGSQTRTGEHEQLDNIITFIGRRGTGKSSSMLSFMESLKNNAQSAGDDNKEYVIKSHGRSVRFIGLEWIDASLIEKGEDIFEITLAEMMNEFLDLDEKFKRNGDTAEYEVRRLHQMFDSIYKRKLSLKKRSGDVYYYGNESAVATLRDLARSSDLRKDFEELIKQYIKVKQILSDDRSYHREETFLVVAIDDIDMNTDSGFEMLEKIQRYLKVRGLIVLLAVNYEQLLISCEKHFMKLYGDNNRYAGIARSRQISEIVDEYMEKALPSYMRVYLPSLKKKDYDREQLTRVRLEINGEQQEMSIKNAMFFVAERKTKVRYDSQGKKRHFMEPGSLRSLNSQFLFFKDLKDPEPEQKNFIETLNHNYRWSMDDLLFRYAFENLPLEERRFFIRLSEEDIRRRGEFIVANLLGELGRRKERELLFIVKNGDGGCVHEFQKETGIFGYSYGQLMRGLFFLGREPVFEKRLVHAILGMYSLVLTKIFYNYKQELKKGLFNGNNYRMLGELFGGSAAGSWSLYLIPKMRRETGGRDRLFSGAVKSIRMAGLQLPAGRDLLEKLKDLKAKCGTDELEENLFHIVMSMEHQIILILFLSEFRSDTMSDLSYELKYHGPIPLERRMSDGTGTEGADNWMAKDTDAILFGKCTADYNVLNFINNIFMFEEVISNFIKAMACLLMGGSDKIDRKKLENLTEKVKKRLFRSRDRVSGGFCRNMHEWTKKYGGMVVPAYSADIYYNMLKRLARQCRKKSVPDIKGDQLFDYLQGLLADIRGHLETSDEFYSTKKCPDRMFRDAFDECPVIRILMDSESSEMKELYNLFVTSLLTVGDNENGRLSFYEDTGALML